MTYFEKMIVAVDGPASSGKGSLCDLISKNLRFFHFDSGLFYRRVISYLSQKNIDPYDLDLKILSLVGSENFCLDELRSEKIAKMASDLAKNSHAKQVLSTYQRDFAKMHPLLIMDGRDIGTYVFPEADVKFFLTADIDVRARRRAIESGLDFMQVKLDLNSRDEKDLKRSTAPLRCAHDAIVVDTTFMLPQDVFEFAKERILYKFSNCPT